MSAVLSAIGLLATGLFCFEGTGRFIRVLGKFYRLITGGISLLASLILVVWLNGWDLGVPLWLGALSIGGFTISYTKFLLGRRKLAPGEKPKRHDSRPIRRRRKTLTPLRVGCSVFTGLLLGACGTAAVAVLPPLAPVERALLANISLPIICGATLTCLFLGHDWKRANRIAAVVTCVLAAGIFAVSVIELPR